MQHLPTHERLFLCWGFLFTKSSRAYCADLCLPCRTINTHQFCGIWWLGPHSSFRFTRSPPPRHLHYLMLRNSFYDLQHRVVNFLVSQLTRLLSPALPCARLQNPKLGRHATHRVEALGPTSSIICQSSSSSALAVRSRHTTTSDSSNSRHLRRWLNYWPCTLSYLHDCKPFPPTIPSYSPDSDRGQTPKHQARAAGPRPSKHLPLPPKHFKIPLVCP